MIKTKNISMHYGSSQVLFDINIDIKKAKITSLMGSNGVGKTSFLKLLSGIHTVSSGEFYFDNKNVTKQKSYHHNNRLMMMIK